MSALLVRFGIPLLAIGLLVFALVDAITVPDDSMYRAGNKLIWVIVIVLLPIFVGPLIYLAIGRPRQQRPTRRPRQIPPDDLI
jgi:uncharacterized membrane protein